MCCAQAMPCHRMHVSLCSPIIHWVFIPCPNKYDANNNEKSHITVHLVFVCVCARAYAANVVDILFLLCSLGVCVCLCAIVSFLPIQLLIVAFDLTQTENILSHIKGAIYSTFFFFIVRSFVSGCVVCVPCMWFMLPRLRETTTARNTAPSIPCHIVAQILPLKFERREKYNNNNKKHVY